MSSLEASTAALTLQRRSQDAEIESLSLRWLPHLRAFIEGMSSRFGASMRRMGCSGKLELFEDADGRFRNFGVHIMVAFR